MKPSPVATALAVAAIASAFFDHVRLEAQSGSAVVISEFRTRGPAGGNDEFIELFNPSASPVDITGWKISGSNSAGTVSDRATIPAITLKPGCFFLVVNSAASGYSGTVAGNLTYTTGITDDGGIALRRADNSIVDQVGLSVGSAFGEGTRLSSFGTINSDRSLARTPTAGTDSGNNAADFVTTSPSGPQNLDSIAGCTDGPTDQGKAVISQLYGGGGNTGSVFTNDFIELFNPGPNAVNLAGWSVQYAPSTSSSWSVTPLSGTIPPGRYHLVQEAGGTSGTMALPIPDSTGTIGMSASDGKVALVRSVSPLNVACPSGSDVVDLVGYGGATCFEGATPAPGLGANTSGVRAQAGCIDTNVNGSDFGTASPPTPRNSGSPLNDCVPPPEIWPHDVQGSGNISPLVGQLVAVRGIVTAKRFNNGFFIKTPDSVATLEGDPATSEAVFVFTSSAPTVNVGDDVVVTGTVTEFVPSADLHQPPVTEITAPAIAVRAPNQLLPLPIALTATDLNPNGGPLQLERYEGMRVAASALTVVAPTSGTVNEANATGGNNGVFYAVFGSTPRPFREAGIDVIDPPPACDEHAAGVCAIPVFDGNPERLRIDSDGQVGVFPGAIVSTGATMSISAGVLDYAFRTWTILPDASALTMLSPGIGPQPVPARAAGEYLVATFNLERFFDTSDAPGTDDPVLSATAYANRLAKASLIIRDYLRAPDIIGVEEAENVTVLQDLASKIDVDAGTAGQPPPGYQAFLEEGNDIGGIDVGFLVRSNVTVHSVTQWRKDETYVNPANGMNELLNDRPSLVLDATVSGGAQPAHVVVVVNHLRSLNGVDDAADGRRVRAKRKAQAESVAQLLIDLQAQYPGVPIVSVGDYNAFEVSDGYVDVLGIIRGNQAPPEQVVDWSTLGLNPNVMEALSPGDYSYSFDGNAQTLDHVLLSSAAASTLAGIHHARIDADFPEAFRADPTRPERLSDHDPAVARFSFPADTNAPVFGPVPDVTVPATSFDGATVTFTLPTATDDVDPTVSVVCAPASGTFFPVGPTTVTCSASDAAHNTATMSFVVTVQAVDEAGAMLGAGVVNDGRRVVFALLARQTATGTERGHLHAAFSRARGLPDRFVAQDIDAVLFFGSAVRFSGTGEWNGVPGYTFVAEASDGHRSAPDAFAVTVSNSQGAVVAHVSAALSGGNIERVR